MNHTKAGHRIASAWVGALLVAMVTPALPAVAAEPQLEYSQQKVYGFGGAALDRFGGAVAVWGDTALVGAPFDDDEGANSGSVHVYTRTAGRWYFRTKLTAADGAASAYFGCAVALSGDTALIGAEGDAAGRGSAYIFTGSGTSWTEQAKLVPSAGEASDEFGHAVALDGGTALVGSWDEDEKGAAYIFTGSGSSWTQRKRLVAADAEDNDYFGCSVALDAGTAIVGAAGCDGGRGAAYVFTGSGESWSLRKRIVAADGAGGDWFGWTVALDSGTALIGAPHDDSYAGSAYIYTGSASTWTFRKKLLPSATSISDEFGSAVSLSGGTALVGAPHDDPVAFDSGAAYVFTGSGSTWTERVKLLAPDGVAEDWFGRAVALSGGTALVAAPGDDDLGTSSGSGYFHTFNAQLTAGVTRIAGINRYLTAVAASRRGFPAGAPAVIVATGENWPDALGGSALAGSAHGPLLLTRKDAMPAEVAAEIRRLGAVKAYVLGSTASVSAGVENALTAMLGRTNVVRLGGIDRYATARLVADEAIRLQGTHYTGIAFVTTGLNYPDATAASPLAAYLRLPIMLASPRASSVYLHPEVDQVVVLGSEAAVPAAIYDYLLDRLGTGQVVRTGGVNRYATAAMVADAGVLAGMQWNGVGLATGENFPDALAAGPMLATNRSVLLLTRPTALPGETQTKLFARRSSIASMFIFGDINAVSSSVETAAKAAAGL